MSISAVIKMDQTGAALVNEIETRSYPQLIKYMGSKAKIIRFVSESIASVYNGGILCDLFSGAGSLSGALGSIYPMRACKTGGGSETDFIIDL
jgi:hypothetical protein